MSRAQSVVAGEQFEFNIDNQDHYGSQLNSLFPWDNAGASSSSGMVPLGQYGSDNMNADPVDVKMRGSSRSRRDSSLIPSQLASVGNVKFSPAPTGNPGSLLGEDFEFPGTNSPKIQFIGAL